MTDVINQPSPPTPHLVVSDTKAAIAFYVKAFGAEETFRMTTPDGSRVVHANLIINGGPVMLADDCPDWNNGQARHPLALGATPVTIHLQVADVDAAFARAVEAGATATMPPADMFWGDRYGKLRDPFGHEWSLATTKSTPSRAEMEDALKRFFDTNS
ncbi:MAG TPA: VOC family protein [Azospirillum sp.]|nr:VOC family protein [Azospirillum sp.]